MVQYSTFSPKGYKRLKSNNQKLEEKKEKWKEKMLKHSAPNGGHELVF